MTKHHDEEDEDRSPILEATDRQILSLLEGDGRMSWTELGHQTGLSTSAAQQRVKRLEAKGIICGYHWKPSAQALRLLSSSTPSILRRTRGSPTS